ncbi:MAG: hypothetical protein KOO61_09615 [Spirochaetales bacterium]|nr:hypothetical protein [Spirochaetales bacterium]
MPEIFDQNPSSRVFHVDQECYVLYLGAHWDDYKPFLRLGTSVHLPAGLPPIVSTIVVPDVLTGSPLDEPASLAGDATAGTHYVGDVKTINKLKAFLKQETIAVEALKKADHETDDNRHVFVYSYQDGNLKIKYHKSEIFDLHRRERQDGHFVARAQSIKNEFGRGPFKLPVDAYQRPGFAVVAGVGYLIARGEIAALSLSNDYFGELAGAGIDPDRLTTVHIASADDALLRFFKRSRAKGKTARVSAPRGDEIKALAGVFRANSLPGLKVNLLNDGSFAFHRFTVGQAPGRVEATLQELDGPIVFGSGASQATSAVVLDSSAGTLTLGGRKRPLLDGCVYQLAGESLSRTFVTERYLPEKNYPYRDMLSQEENNLLGQIGFFFSELFAGRDVGKVLRTIRSSAIAKDLSRGASLDPVTAVIVANTLEFIRFLRAAEPEAGSAAGGLASILEKHDLTPSSVPATLPLIAEISYRENIPYLFYRFTSRITSDRVAHADRVAQTMRAAPLFDFESERNRLADLVAGLANPEQMEEARLRRIAERKKPRLEAAAASADEEKPESTEEQDKTGAVARGRSARRAGGSGRRGSSRGGPWRWLLPVAAVVLLLIALGALLATGTIPNRWFAEDTAAEDTMAEDTMAEDTAHGDDALAADGGSETADASGTDVADTTDGSDSSAATTADADAADDVETGSDGSDGTDDSILPEGWPPETLPAIRALLATPGVIITDERVVGPGGIEITVMDIINLVNRIATENGYAPMHTIDLEHPDPDWIYPENVFVLPNGTRYTVVGGDTLWDITVRYMVARLGQDYEMYVHLTEEHEGAGISDQRRDEIEVELLSIGNESHSENYTRMVARKLAEWRE